MTDNPYGLDFFQKITDCHWGGGNWLFVQMSCISPSAVLPWQLFLNFIGESGGTPGLVSDDGAVVGSIGNDLSLPDRVLTRDDINRTFICGAGLELQGLCFNQHNSGQNNPSFANFLVRMGKLDQTFRVRMQRVSDPGFRSNIGMTIGTVDDKTVVPGALLPGLTLVNSVGQSTAVDIQDFLINQTTLSITPL